MKTLQQVQEEYARGQGYENWEGLLFSFQYTRIMKIDELIKHQNAVIQIVQDELKITQHVNLANLKLILRSLKLCLEAHPDNEPNSEFEDRISDLLDCNNLLDSILNTENIK